MAPLIVLVVISLGARVGGWLGVDAIDSWAVAIAIGLAAMFALSSSAHFTQPRREGMISIVPPQLPAPGALVTFSGIVELVGAVALLIPETRRAAAIGLCLLLVALFPANVYAAGEQRHPAAPHTPLVLRTAIQIIFIAACVAVIVL